MRVLLVEDDSHLASVLHRDLEIEGHEVVVESAGEEAFFRINTETFDLILLDSTLPGRNGLEIVRAARQRGVKTPVLVLTDHNNADERASAIESGADDCLVKPVSLSELSKRIRSVFNRKEEASRLILRDLTMDLSTRTVTRGGKPIKLTLREFEVLELLMRNKGQIISREMLTRQVWREDERTKLLDNAIDVCFVKLRRKVEIDPVIKLLHTVANIGFVMTDVPDQPLEQAQTVSDGR